MAYVLSVNLNALERSVDQMVVEGGVCQVVQMGIIVMNMEDVNR
jgi:hypothetical protein